MHEPRTDVPRDACTNEQARWWIFCNVYFIGQLNFAMSPRLFCIKQQLFCWIESLFEQIHNISLTAACAVKTGFKVKEILYDMRQQPDQPFLINHSIGVLARELQPLAERLTVDSGTALRPSE